MAEKQKTLVWRLIEYFVVCSYFAVSALWIFFIPVFAITMAPDRFKFLSELGQYDINDLQREHYFLMGFGYLFLLANIGFLIWHFLVKRYRNNIFKNRFYYFGIMIGNATLAYAYCTRFLGPIYS